MMKILLYIVSLWFLFTQVIGSEISGKLKSKVETEYFFEEQFGKYEAIQKTKHTSVYNINGQLIVKYERDIDKRIDRYLYEYDDMGGLTMVGGDQKIIFWENEYDSLGNLIKAIARDDEESPLNNLVHKYDSNRNVIESSYYSEDSERLTKKTKNKFDSLGHLIDESDYNRKGELAKKSKHTYNSAGNKIKFATYYRDGRVISKKIYTYGISGKLQKVDEYEKNRGLSGGLYMKQKLIYNQGEYLIELIEYSEDNLVDWKITYSIDDRGNTIAFFKYKSGQSLMYKGTFKYDENNRIIEQLSYEYKDIYGERKAIPFEKISYKYEYH